MKDLILLASACIILLLVEVESIHWALKMYVLVVFTYVIIKYLINKNNFKKYDEYNL